MAKHGSPIRWFGGKGQQTSKLIPMIPDHRIYVEVFGGGASLLFAKDPSPIEIYNDLDSGLVNFFSVMRDADKLPKLYYLVSTTPYSREEYFRCRETWRACEDPVERAYRWYVCNRMSFGGKFGASWARSVESQRNGMAARPGDWISGHQRLSYAHERMMRVQIEQQDFRRLIPSYDTPQTLFYIDPPYVPETRRSGEYEHELTIEDHRDLVELLLQIEGKTMLSGYRHEVYKPLERAGWKRASYAVKCTTGSNTRVSGRTGAGALDGAGRTECVWISPSAIRRRRRRSGPRAKLCSPIHYTPCRRAVA